MRWLYYDPDSPAEVAAREKRLRRIERWWEAFRHERRDIEAALEDPATWDLPAWMARNLQSIDRRLAWEFGREQDGSHWLVITPECSHALRPMVRTILQKAPRIEGWSFLGARQARPWPHVVECVGRRLGGDVSATRASARLGEENRIDLTFYLPECRNDGDDHVRHQAFLIGEGLLGEETLDKWIGAIDVAPLPAAQGRPRGRRAGTIPAESLPERVEALRNAVIDQLPSEPVCVHGTAEIEHALLELNPRPRSDYPERYDLRTAITANLPMWRSAHSGRPFYSERFSRCGETFAYLKLTGRWRSPEEQFEARQRLADLLDDALMKRRVGCTIGGGTGLKYAYIDLALLEIRPAVGILRRSLQAAGIGKRSWLLFFDSELADEWVGIHPDSPPPPRGR